MNDNRDKYKIGLVLFKFKLILILLNKIKFPNPKKKTGAKFNKNKSVTAEPYYANGVFLEGTFYGDVIFNKCVFVNQLDSNNAIRISTINAEYGGETYLLEQSNLSNQKLATNSYADGGKILFNYGQSTPQNYRLEYGRYTQDSQEGKLLVEETSDANDIGRAYQFTINGITT